jgi:hypothetical protein
MNRCPEYLRILFAHTHITCEHRERVKAYEAEESAWLVYFPDVAKLHGLHH